MDFQRLLLFQEVYVEPKFQDPVYTNKEQTEHIIKRKCASGNYVGTLVCSFTLEQIDDSFSMHTNPEN